MKHKGRFLTLIMGKRDRSDARDVKVMSILISLSRIMEQRQNATFVISLTKFQYHTSLFLQNLDKEEIDWRDRSYNLVHTNLKLLLPILPDLL
jgi:hypothetical protein